MAENGMRPISDIQPQDIIVCGFPRSGHTWFQNLLAGVVFGIDPELAHDSLIQDLVPDVHYKRCYKRYGPTAYFKSHALPQKEYRRVVYLLRDGRDVMVSYYHFLSALQGHVDFVKLVQTERWHEHVEHWHANPQGADMLVGHQADRVEHRLFGLDRMDGVALAFEQMFDQAHGEPSSAAVPATASRWHPPVYCG